MGAVLIAEPGRVVVTAVEPRAPTRWVRWGVRVGGRVGLSLMAILITLSAAELGVSWVDPYGVSYFPDLNRYDAQVLVASDDEAQVFQQRPSVSIDAGVPIRTNALGLRNREIQTKKPIGTRRILFLGDSVTFGWGVREGAAFPSRVEARFASLVPPGDGTVEVVNGGVVHYNTVQESRLLEHLLPHVDPDLVVVVYTGNDLYVADPSPILGRSAPAERPGDLDGLVSDFDWWMLTNQVDLSLAHLLRFMTMNRLSRVDPESSDVDRQRRRAAVLADHLASSSPKLDPQGCVDALLDMRRRCAERGVELVVAPFDAPEVLIAFCRAKGIPILDDPGVAGDPVYRLSATDAHPNEAGHDRMAESFVSSMIALELVPAPRDRVTLTASSITRSRSGSGPWVASRPAGSASLRYQP